MAELIRNSKCLFLTNRSFELSTLLNGFMTTLQLMVKDQQTIELNEFRHNFFPSCEMDKGSNFVFSIDLEQVALMNKIDNEIAETQKFGSDISEPRILLVEDDAVTRKLISIFARGYKWSITAVENGKEAVEILQKQHFDLILMDIQMPVMDGFIATELIRKLGTCDTIPIIAMTALGFKEVRAKCLNSGMNDYLTKPVSFDELNTIVNKWI